MNATVLFLTLFVLSESLLANVLWSSRGETPPRSQDVVREDGAPCGTAERGNAAQLSSGSNIDLEWNEFVPQEGSFEIYFSPANDENWVLLEKINNKVDDPNATFVNHKATVKLPREKCENCTLQIIQVVPGSVESKYYSCADISLQGEATSTTSVTTEDFCPQ